MAITRSSARDRAEVRRVPRQRGEWRRHEFICMLATGLVVAVGLYQVHKAKSQGLAEIEHGLAARQLLDLNHLSTREELLPALSQPGVAGETMFPDPAERELVARKIFYASGGLANVGAIARIRVTADDMGHAR